MTAFAGGLNERAQLAAAYRGPAEGPVSCTALRTDVAIRQIKAAYKGFTVILYEDDTVYTVGGGVNGQLGVGTHKDHYLPVKVSLPPVAEIAVAGAHVLARLHDGRIAYWGGNSWGTRGNGTSDHGLEGAGTPTPEFVAGITDAIAIATANGNCAVIHADGTVSMWGVDLHGNNGDGRTLPISSNEGLRPQKVPGLNGVTAIALGGSGDSTHALAILAGGGVVQWGARGACGTSNDLLVPTPIVSLANIIAVAAGPGQSFALDSANRLHAWGSNVDEQLWLPESLTHVGANAIQVVLDKVAAVAAGYQYSLAITLDGTVEGTGRNDTHQLALVGLEQATQIHAGEAHAVALANQPPIAPPVVAHPTTGGADVEWTYQGTPAKRWEISQRAAYTGQIWSKPVFVEPAGRKIHIAAPTGVPTEIRVRNGTVYPSRMAQVVPA